VIQIDAEFQALIPPLSAEEHAQLEANLVADGCRDPLVVWAKPAPEPGEHKCYAYDKRKCDLVPLDDVWHCRYCEHNPAPQECVLVDGHNRHEICTRLGIDFETVEQDFDTREDVIVWMVDNQGGRRNLNDFQRTELQLRKKGAIAARAKARQQGGQGGVLLSENSTEAIDTREQVAAAAGVSSYTVSKVDAILGAATPELLTALRAGDVSINAAADVATLPKPEQAELVARGTKEILQAAKQIRAERSEERRNERLKKIVAISTGNAPVGSIAERYPVIYLDPPWRYDYAESDSRAIENQYPTMSLDEIKAMNMDQVAFDDCVMFMWATSPKLAEALDVLRAWGFEYRTCAVWDKQKIGMGYYFRQQHELLLVAVKGEPTTPAPADRPSSVFSFERGEHSAKPHEVYELIEAMYPTLPKLEMFCRTPREGWGVWGNQSKAA
jgi:N6-adenosine-specific RNA methylase IME4